MKFKNKLLILIMVLAIASAQWVPAFAASKDNSETKTTTKAQVEIEAEAAIVMDADTGEILYKKDAYSKRQPASVTKIVTCMLALENLELDQKVKVKTGATDMGSIIDVKKGEVFTAEQLIYALMLPSANDAAVVLAEEIGGDVDTFCEMMDEYAKKCGAKNTHFRNPNGLNWAGQEDHLTTAYDLAVITKEALKNKTFRKVVSTLNYTIPATNKSKARKLTNTNKFLWTDAVYEKAQAKENKKSDPETIYHAPEFEGVIGVKTGLTSTAGGCFVGAANVNGTELIAVVLHSDEDQRFGDAATLWQYALDKYYETQVLEKQDSVVEKIRVKRGAVRKVEAATLEEAAVTVPKGADTSEVRVEITEDELRAPVQKGDKVGVLKVYNGDELVDQTDLYAVTTVEEGGFLSIFGIPDSIAPVIYGILIILLLIVGVLVWMHVQTERQRRQREEKGKERRRNV